MYVVLQKKVHDHFNPGTRFPRCHVINRGAIQPHNSHLYQA